VPSSRAPHYTTTTTTHNPSPPERKHPPPTTGSHPTTNFYFIPYPEGKGGEKEGLKGRFGAGRLGNICYPMWHKVMDWGRNLGRRGRGTRMATQLSFTLEGGSIDGRICQGALSIKEGGGE